jgi:hypothetical protein
MNHFLRPTRPPGIDSRHRDVPSHMAHDVFISDSSKDKPVADAVGAGLENTPQGFKVKIPR